MRVRKCLTGVLMALMAAVTLAAVALPDTARAQTAEELEGMQVPLLRHRPIYFALHDGESKVQLSFRFALSEESNFYFAYTQIMFWSLFENSLPMEEIRYKPELFYRFRPDSPWLSQVNLGLNEHDSNGQDGDASRGYDAAYLETVSFLDPGGRDIRWSNRFFGYYDLSRNNKDFAGYRSTYETRFDYRAGLLGDDRMMLRAVLRDRGEVDEEEDGFGLGAFEVGYRFPIPHLNNGALQFYIQYYDGYNETWRAYDERTQTVRAGFMLR